MLKNHRFTALLLAGAFGLAPALSAQESAKTPVTDRPAGTAAGARPGTRWTDPDGKPLPFASEDELIAFLATAEVKSEQALSGGVTFPRKILLEKDGVRANAVFRDVNEDSTNAPSFGGGRDALLFRDSYIYEPAAYKLSRMLGLDNVPPATLRKVRNKNGSVQIWVENSMTEKSMNKQGIKPPDEKRWNKQLQIMNTFDALVYNTDRNSGNVLITPDWKLWMIDHTRAFRRNPGLQQPDAIKQCERGFYQKLKGLDEKAAAAALKEDLSPYEIEALFKRRALLVEHLDRLIAEKGESQVLYVDTEDTAPGSAP
jgi:hypothetical protein